MEKKELFYYSYHFLLNSTLQPKTDDSINNAIARAHRDVLTGRFHLSDYCNSQKNNHPKDFLERIIKETKLKNTKSEPIGSMELIDYLYNNFKPIEFGAIQKLVNMTLKYLYLISLDSYSTDLSEYFIDIKKYDCPLDSKILSKLEKKHTPWTRIEKDEYIKVQNEIKEHLKDKNKYYDSNLLFDLLYY